MLQVFVSVDAHILQKCLGPTVTQYKLASQLILNVDFLFWPTVLFSRASRTLLRGGAT